MLLPVQAQGDAHGWFWAVVCLAVSSMVGWAQEAAAQVLVQPGAVEVTVTTGAQVEETVDLINTTAEALLYAVRGSGAPQAGVGPVGAGYSWTDSREADGPPFDWVELAGVGTPLALQNDGVVTVPLPFGFSFYGVTHHRVGISPHGFLTFGTSGSFSQHMPLPSDLAPASIIAPLWYTYDPDDRQVYTYYDAARQRFIVQFRLEATIFTGPIGTTGTYIFQVHLYADGSMRFLYEEVPDMVRGTVGIQNEFRQQGLTLAYNRSYLADGFAVTLRPAADFVAVEPATGQVAAGQRQTLLLRFDAVGRAKGIYRDTLRIATSDPMRPVLAVPLRMVVGQEDSPFQVTPQPVMVELVRRQRETVTLTLQNNDDAHAQAFRIAVKGDAAVTPPLPTRRQDRDHPALAKALPVAYSTNLNLLGAPAQFMRFQVNHAESVESVAQSPTSYAGDFLYGDDTRFYIITTNRQMQAVDVATGLRTVIGPSQPLLSDEVWTGLATDPSTGTLYGSTVRNNSTSSLYTLDPATGEATRIGVIFGAAAVVALAVDAAGNLYGLDIDSDQLVLIDETNGVATPVGALGFDANLDQGMDFDPATGKLYLTSLQADGLQGAFREVDPATGQATLMKMFPAGTHLGYLALPSGSFVSADVYAGRIDAGGQQEITVTVDAGSLLAGTYRTALQVVAHDRAGQPVVEVPILLTVKSSPRISLIQADGQFGQVPVGAVDTDGRLLIQNTGFDDLNLSLRFDSFIFRTASLSEGVITVRPGEVIDIPLAFEPTNIGLVQGTVSIESNDPVEPTLTVLLRGEGIPPPLIDVEPEAVVIHAAVGHQHEQQITLRNTGTRAITFAITPDTRALDAGLREPLLEEHFEERIPRTWRVIDHEERGVVWKHHTAFGDQEYGNYTGGSGGAAMVSSHAAPGVPFDAELRTPALVASTENLTLRFRVNFITGTEPASLNLDVSTDEGTTWNTIQRWSDDVGQVFAAPGALIEVPLAPVLNEGDLFHLRWRYVSQARTPTDFYAQIDEVTITTPTDVLALDVAQGVLAPSEAVNVTVQVNAEGVLPGQYALALDLELDDSFPVTQQVPMTLHVVDETYLMVQPAEVNPNDEVTVPIHVVSPDLAALEAYTFDVVFDEALLTFQDVATSNTLSAGATIETVPVAPGQIQVRADAFSAPPSRSEGVLLGLRFKGKTTLGTTTVDLAAPTLNQGALSGTAAGASVEVVPRYGDVDFDLAVTYNDASRLTRFAAGHIMLSPAARVAGDVDGDGRAGLADAGLIRQYVEESIICFPVDMTCAEATAGSKHDLAVQQKESTTHAVPFELGASYPNPMRTSTTIPFAVAQPVPVELTIYNALGQPVRRLLDQPYEAGHHTAHWDGRSDAGRAVAGGVYFYRLRAGDFVQTRQFVVVP